MAKGIGSLAGGGMMQQIQRMQQQLAQAQAQLSQETVTGSAGGQAVKVVLTGDQKCQSVEISHQLVQDGDVEMLQDLVLASFNQALEKARALAAERLGPLAGGLPF
jgi:hypothetical protein